MAEPRRVSDMLLFWNLKPQIRRRVEMCVAEISQEMDIFDRFLDGESIFNRKLLISTPIQKCHHHNLLIFFKMLLKIND